MPSHCLLTALEKRIIPKACFGAQFLILRADWAKRLDACLDRWVAHILAVPKRQHRIRLLFELGFPMRLSTRTLLAAFGLFARIQVLPDSHVCRPLAELASSRDSTWTFAMEARLSELGVPPPGQWCMEVCGMQTQSQRKRAVKRYMAEVVQEALWTREKKWQEEALSALPYELPADSWASIAEAGASHRQVLRWSAERFEHE